MTVSACVVQHVVSKSEQQPNRIALKASGASAVRSHSKGAQRNERSVSPLHAEETYFPVLLGNLRTQRTPLVPVNQFV